MPSPTSLTILKATAPAVTGIAIRKLARAAASRLKPEERGRR